MNRIRGWWNSIYIDWEAVLFGVFLTAIFGGLVSFIVFSEQMKSEGSRACLDAGYPEAKTYFNGDTYCTKIENGSSVTIKLFSKGEQR